VTIGIDDIVEQVSMQLRYRADHYGPFAAAAIASGLDTLHGYYFSTMLSYGPLVRTAIGFTLQDPAFDDDNEQIKQQTRAHLDPRNNSSLWILLGELGLAVRSLRSCLTSCTTCFVPMARSRSRASA
jgi:hypothetical protein